MIFFQVALKYPMVFFIRFFFAVLVWTFASQPALAQSTFEFPQGKIELISDKNQLALYFQTIPEWHTYWKNSGDSGAAPILEFVDNNFTPLPYQWSFPQRIAIEGIVNFGYDSESLLLIPIQISGENPTGQINLEVLVCKVECIPYLTTLTIPQQIQPARILELQQKFQFPQEAPTTAKLTLDSLADQKATLTLQISDWNFLDYDEIQIFPANGENFASAVPDISLDGSELQVTFGSTATSTQGLESNLFLFGFFKDQKLITSFEIPISHSAPPALLFTFLAALLGGLILNLMPCVFPVLSIKALSLLKQGTSPQLARRQGWLYTLGVCLSFLILGLILLILRMTGEQVGWGFQMQNPWIVASLAMLFFWISLNFLGTYEVDLTFQFENSKKKSPVLDSFWSGVLATLVATPCTAPFMGTALGASLALPAVGSLGIFLCLGIGMALPFLILGYFPKLTAMLPRPGAWMETFRNFLAFPMLLTVLWLLWVLSLQAGSSSLLYLIFVSIFIAFVIWSSQKIRSERFKKLLLGSGFAISLLATYWLPIEKTQIPTNGNGQLWQSFDSQKIQSDLAEGRSVFIDFTAAWCITCQVNKKVVLRTAEIEKHFTENKISLYSADWTDKDPLITQELAKYGRNSLPLYVYLKDSSSKAVILPEILTKEIVLKTTQTTEEK